MPTYQPKTEGFELCTQMQPMGPAKTGWARPRRLMAFGAVLVLALATFNAQAQEDATNSSSNRLDPLALKKLTITELMNIEVTLVSGHSQKLSETASAIQVVTQEDIRRSGATTLPEALRLASNLEVAQVNTRDWAISARGFNNTLANKLLVMIDGRTVYTPLYAGVWWDMQSVLLEDVDRIEVVSGPGGTRWGANAVNGVINVVTKSARDTQGVYVSGAAGSFLQDFGAVRYGGSVGSNLFYRVYGQRFDFNNTILTNGLDARDRWDMTKGGFRMDWYPSAANTFTVQGDIYGGNEQGAVFDTSIEGQNLLGRWYHELYPDSHMQFQTYFDRTWRDVPNSFAEDLKTYDFDFQHQIPIGERHVILWGAGYRLMQDRINNSGTVSFLPPDKNLQLFSTFVQDEIMLVRERLKLTIGTKIEHNDYSGIEVQPSARLAWMLDKRQTIWSAVSRAVRSPSRIDTELYSPAINLAGGPGFTSEKLLAFEVGYRVQATETLSVSLSPYYHYYQDLRSLDQPTPPTLVLGNHFRGQVWGAELSAQFQATERWRLRGGYNFMNKNLWPHGGVGVSPSVREGNDPDHQFSFQSMLDLPGSFQFDMTGRYVDTLHSPHVDSYFTFDARLGWTYKNLEISLIGQNLYESKHVEFGTRQIPRSVLGKVTCRF